MPLSCTVNEILSRRNVNNCRFITTCKAHNSRINSTIYGPLEEWCSYNFAAGSFHTKKLCSRLFDRSWNLLEKIAKSRFMPPFGGVRGNVRGSSMARWKARGRLPISANWTFFASSYSWNAMSKYWSKLCCLKGGWVILSANFRGRRVIHQRIFASETRGPGLSRGVVCVILRLAVLIQYRRVTPQLITFLVCKNSWHSYGVVAL